MSDNNKNKIEIPTSSWATLHYFAGLLCLLGFMVALGQSSEDEALYLLAVSLGCFIFGTILQSLKTICFFLRKIYERMN